MKNPESRFFSFLLALAVFTSAVFCAANDNRAIPRTDEQALAFFTEAAKSYSVSVDLHSDPLEIDMAFWRKDGMQNVYYAVTDTSTQIHQIVRFAPDGRAEFFVPKREAGWQILHFDVSGDGRFIFLEMFHRASKTPELCYMDTENPDEGVTLRRLKGDIRWRTSTLVYSDANECLYFHTYAESQKVNGMSVDYDSGFYVCRKAGEGFSADGVIRYGNIPAWFAADARRAFLQSGNRDFSGLLDWIFYRAQPGEKVFCYEMPDGTMLTNEAALEYLEDSNLFDNSWYFLEKCVRRVKDGVITDETAFTYDNEYARGLPVMLSNLPFHCWFLKSEGGIWCFTEISVQYIDDKGQEAWKCGYMMPFWVEKADGTKPNPAESPFYMNRITGSIEIGSQTALVHNDALVCKLSNTQIWAVVKNGTRTDFETQEDALAFAEGELVSGDDAAPVAAKGDGKEAHLLVIIIIICCIAVLELAALVLVLSKSFKNHLSKADKRLVFRIQEAERVKISRDLHDSVVQNVRAIRLDAEMLEVKEGFEAKKQALVDEITNVISLMRNICYSFHPAELSVRTDNTELISVIDTLCQQFIARTKIPCQIQLEKDFSAPKLTEEASVNVVRVVQEALQNIEKHSYATSVQVVIRMEDDDALGRSLVIFIIDDGIGCDVSKAQKSKMHFGLRNMRERITGMGGRIEFFSNHDEGMSVQICVPVGDVKKQNGGGNMVETEQDSLFIVDDHSMLRNGLKSYLELNSRWRVRGMFGSGTECMRELRTIQGEGRSMPQLAIIDIQLGDESGFALVEQIKKFFCGIKIVIYSMYDTWGFILQAQDLGVQGYISKVASEKELMECLDAVAGGGTWYEKKSESIQKELNSILPILKKQERKILELVLQDRTNKKIADELFISLHTVENYVSYLVRIAGCKTREELIEKFR